MKEDILEQIADDWLLSMDSTFTKSNVRFKPDQSGKDYLSSTDSNTSDIDLIAVHLNKKGKNRVAVVTCKSYQKGFDTNEWVKLLTTNDGLGKKGGREAWKYFRELTRDKWAKAFVDKIYFETGQRSFKYIVAVTTLKNNRTKDCFQNCTYFKRALRKAGAIDFEISIVTASEMLDVYYKNREGKKQTLEATQLGRLMQIIAAAGLKLVKK